MRQLDPKKGLFSIGVAAEIIGVEPRVLRIYEKKGLIQPNRTDGNRRLYSIQDLEVLEYVHYMTHVRKVNLPGVKAILSLLDKLPPEVLHKEMANVEHAIDQLDEMTRKMFVQGSSTVERSLLDEHSETTIHREAQNEMEQEESGWDIPDKKSQDGVRRGNKDGKRFR